MKKASILLVFTAIFVASFCQTEYSTYRFFNWIAATPNYYTDYEKVLALNKVKSITEIVLPHASELKKDSLYVYGINKRGRIVSFTSRLFDYNDVSEYNDAGFLVAEIRFSTPANDTLYKALYTYDMCGHVTDITFWAEKNGLLTWQYINHYDSQCRLRVQEINHAGKRHFSAIYEYDSAGNIVTIQKRDANDKVSNTIGYEYDSLRRIIAESNLFSKKRIIYNATGRVEKIYYESAIPSETYTYYPNGLKKEVIIDNDTHIEYGYTFYK